MSGRAGVDERSAPMTLRQKQAFAWMQAAREAEPTTSDGMMIGGQTFYDQEVKVAYVNIQTARALARRGLIRIGEWWPDEGCELRLL